MLMAETSAVRAAIGFIGLGAMGAPIARRLLEAGHTLVVSDISRAHADDWTAAGATFVDTPAEVADACHTVFMSLPGPREVEAVADGLMSKTQRGDVVVDLSTNAYATVVALAERLAKAGVTFIDAPVSGGVAGAVRGKLAVMAGGDAAAIAALAPVFEAFAARVFHVGDSGKGTIAKLVNNQIFLSAAVAVQEGFVLAAKAGLDSDTLLEIVKASSGGGYMGMAPLFFGRDFDNAMFRLSLAAKDLGVVLESASDLGVPMPTTKAAHGVYKDAIDQGLGDKVFYATLRALEADAGAEVAKLAPKA
jgi:3-hydroxyisobutyrate dehydrogenase-like beta-hydroxyacid dehydrogenase